VVKSVGSSPSSSLSKFLTLVMRHKLPASSSTRSRAYSRSGAGIKPTSTSSRIMGIPPSTSPALWSISSFSRSERADTRGEVDMSMIRSLRTRGTMTPKFSVKTGLCLLSRNGYELRFVNRSYCLVSEVSRIRGKWCNLHRCCEAQWHRQSILRREWPEKMEVHNPGCPLAQTE